MFKRALIVAALSAAFAAPAFADVAISGSAEMDIYARGHQKSSASNNDGGSTQLGNETDLIINFDGSDKLDGGDKLIWHVGQKVATPSTAAWGSREAYIGVVGNWGVLRSGRVFAPSYLVLDAFQWGAGNLWEDYGANGVWFKEALAYTTPDFGGFSAQVVYDFGTKTAQGQTYAIDAVVSYKGNGLDLNGGYQQQKGLANGVNGSSGFNQDDAFNSGGDTGVKQEFYFAQGNWQINPNYTVRAGWKHNNWRNENKLASVGNFEKAENDQFLIAGAYTSGKHNFALGWQDVANSKVDGTKDTNADLDQFFGQYTYSLSKNTVAYVQGRYMRFKDKDTRPFASVSWQLDGVADTGTDSGGRLLIGTWTGF